MVDATQVLVLLAVLGACLAKPPPGFATDKDSSKYKYEYSVLDGLGGHSGRVESRDGPHTLGGYFVSVPMGHNAMGPASLQQTVSFITDSWGYHPIVSYTTNHGQAVTTAQFALGGKAVAALRQQEHDLQQQQQQGQAAVPVPAEAVASGEPGQLGVPATSLLAPAAPLPTPSATLLPPALGVELPSAPSGPSSGPSGPSSGPSGPSSSPTSTPTPPGKPLAGLLPELSDLPDVANDISGQRGVQVTSFLADTNAAAAQGAPRDEQGALPNLKQVLKGADSISAYVISDADERGNGLADATSATPTASTPTTLKPIVVSEHGIRIASTTPTPPSAYSFGSTVTVTPESASSPSSPSAPSAPSSLGTTAAEAADTASTPTVVITPRPVAPNGGSQDGPQQVASASNTFEVTDDGHQYLAPPSSSSSDDEQHVDDDELQQQQLQQQHELKKAMTSHKSDAVYEAHYRTEVEVQKSVELPSEITLDAVKVADDEHVPQHGAVHAPAYYISQHQQILRQQQHLKDLEEQQRQQQQQQQQLVQEQQVDVQPQQQPLPDHHEHRARKLHHQQALDEQDLQDQRHIQQVQEQTPDIMRIPLQAHHLHLQQDQQVQQHDQLLQAQQDQQLQLQAQQDQQLQLQAQQDHRQLQLQQDQQLQLQAQQDHQLQLQAQQDQHLQFQAQQDHQLQAQQDHQLQLQAQQEQQLQQGHQLQLQAQQGPLEQLQEDPQDLDLQQSVTDTQPQHVQLLQPLTLQLPLQMLQQAHFLQQPNVVHDALLLPPPPQHADQAAPPQELQDAADVVLPEENKLQLEALVQQMAADVTRLVRVEDNPAPTKLVEVEKAPLAAPPPPAAHPSPEQVTRLVHLERPYSHPFMAMQYPPAHGMPHLLPFQHYIALPIKDLQLSESQQQTQHQHPQQLHHKYKISHAVSEDEVTATSHKAVPGIDPDKIVHCAEHVFSFRPSHSMYPAHWKGRSSRRGGPAFRDAQAQGRHRGNLRKLCIEYGGFKPPLVPSTPIKDDGKPVHPSRDD